MGNGKWGMGNGKWEMGRGGWVAWVAWRMEWEDGNGEGGPYTSRFKNPTRINASTHPPNPMHHRGVHHTAMQQAHCTLRRMG